MDKIKIEKQKTKGKKRSPKWRKVRNAFKKKNPKCLCCGGKIKVEIHHIKDFSTYPELELVESNLMPLCERKKYGINCHLLLGHTGNYRKINNSAELDAIIWNYKITQ